MGPGTQLCLSPTPSNINLAQDSPLAKLLHEVNQSETNLGRPIKKLALKTQSSIQNAIELSMKLLRQSSKKL